MLYFSTMLHFDEINMLHSLNYQQNTAYELSALSIQWKELCEKNMEIQAACSKIENQIEELKKEASER
jgi:pre-mRNA-splicing factor SPF27